MFIISFFNCKSRKRNWNILNSNKLSSCIRACLHLLQESKAVCRIKGEKRFQRLLFAKAVYTYKHTLRLAILYTLWTFSTKSIFEERLMITSHCKGFTLMLTRITRRQVLHLKFSFPAKKHFWKAGFAFDSGSGFLFLEQV